MKTIAFFSAVFLSLFSFTVLAAIGPMNYQGRLLDTNGVPVNDAGLEFIVRLYDDPTAGTLQFQERHDSVPVVDGVYSVLVGTGTELDGTWDLALWNTGTTLYLELEIEGETLAPRSVMSASPISFQASNTDMLGSVPADDYAEDSEVEELMSDICQSNHGVWLSQYRKCAGGSVDLSGYDLSGLDISGARFDGADLRYTNNNNTLYQNTLFFDVDLTGAPSISFLNTDFTNSEWKGLDMSGTDISSIVFAGLYAHELISCPSFLPPGWQCVADGNEDNDGLYVLIGEEGRLVSQKGKQGQEWDSSYTTFAGMSLAETNMQNNEFNGVNLSNVDFYAANLKKSVFVQDVQSNAKTNLSGAYLEDANLQNVVMDNVVLDDNTDMANATLTGLRGTNITGCPSNLNPAWTCFTDISTNVLLGPTANLSGELGGYQWGANCKDFSGLNLTGANFSNNQFPTSGNNCGSPNFEYVRMDGTTLTNAVFDNANFGAGTNLAITNCVANNVSFRNVSLQETTFENCDFTNANFAGADLYEAYLGTGNTFDGVNFTNVNLEYADFGSASLVGAIWSNTTCPDSTNSNDNGNTCIGHLTAGP